MDTKFPFPEDPENWQAAYTADNAYYDTDALSPNASRIETLSLLTALIFGIALLFSWFPPKQYSFSLNPALPPNELPARIREAFQSHGITLTTCATLVVQKDGSEWVITDTSGRYLILNEKQTQNVYAKENGLVAFLYRKIPPTKYLFDLDPALISSLDAGQLTPKILADFQSRGVTLTACAKLVVLKPGSEWMIIDTDRRYLIRHEQQNEQQTLKVYVHQDEIIAAAILGIMFFIATVVRIIFQQVGNLAFRRAEKFFEEFYLPSENINPAEIINYRLGGRIKLPMPFREWFTSISQFKYILVKDGDFLKKDQWPVWLACNMGGPILLIVYDGSALYIERGNRFSRVVGPGASFLERYETIKYAVDLRTKSKADKIPVWTKDGIKIELTVCIEYRIGDPQKLDPEGQLIYPYDPEAVKKAIERYALRWPDPTPEPSEFTWEDAAWGQVTGIVPDYIGGRYLDDLLVADRKAGQILSPDAGNRILESLNKATNSFGVYVTDFQILSIKVPDEVEQFYVKYWEAEKESFTTIMNGKAKAFDIRAREKVRADAQHDLILAIAGGLQKNDNERFTEALLLSLSEILDHGLSDPYMRSFTAKETLETLEKLRSILDEKEDI